MSSADSSVDTRGFQERLITNQDDRLAQSMVWVRYARINNNKGALESLRKYLLTKYIPGKNFIAVGLDPRDTGNGEEMGGFAEGIGHLYRRRDRPVMVTDTRTLSMTGLGKEAVVLLGSRGSAKLATVDEVMRAVGQHTWPVYLNQDHDWVKGIYGESLDKTLEVMTREAIALPTGLEFDSSQSEPLGAGNSLIYKLKVSKAGGDWGQGVVALKVPKHKGDVLGNQLIADERKALEALKSGMRRDSVARPVWYWGDYSVEGIGGMFLEWLDQDKPTAELVEELAQANSVDDKRLGETFAMRILAAYNPLIYKAVHGDLVFDSAKFGLNLSNIMAVSLPGGGWGVRLVDFANSKKVGDFEDERKTVFARAALTEMQSLFRVAIYILSQGAYGGEWQERYPLVGMMRRKGITENSWQMLMAEKMSVALNPNESIFEAYPVAISAVTLASNNVE